LNGPNYNVALTSQIAMHLPVAALSPSCKRRPTPTKQVVMEEVSFNKLSLEYQGSSSFLARKNK
jgi:hypothetical protein